MRERLSHNVGHLTQGMESLCQRHPQHAETIRRIAMQMREAFDRSTFVGLSDLALLMRHDVGDFAPLQSLPLAIQQEITVLRRGVFARTIVGQARVSRVLVGPGRTWMRSTRPEREDDPESRESPEDIRNRWEQFIRIAGMVGEKAALEAYRSTGADGPVQTAPPRKILPDALGPCTPPSGGGGSGHGPILPEDPQLLKAPVVYERVRLMLLRRVYQHLFAMDIDSPTQGAAILKQAPAEAERFLRKLAAEGGADVSQLNGLLEDIVATIQKAANYIPPSDWVTELEYKNRLMRFPSFRQRMALVEHERVNPSIVMLGTGKGKSTVPVMCYYEQLRKFEAGEGPKPRLLIVGPKNSNNQIKHYLRGDLGGNAKKRHSWYKNTVADQDRPTVGHIHADMECADVIAERDKDIVFIDDTILYQPMYQGIVADEIAKADPPFTTVAIDEFQRGKGGGTVTRAYHKVLHAPGVTDRMGISATPAPNTLADLEELWKLLSPTSEGQDTSELLRDARDHLVHFDRKEDWEGKITGEQPYAMSAGTQRRMQRIRSVEGPARPKINAMHRIINASPEFRKFLWDFLVQQLSRFDSVLVAVRHLSQGVTRSASAREGQLPALFQDLEQRLQQFARERGIECPLRVIDGEVNAQTDQRERIFEEARQCQHPGSVKKVVTLGKAECFEEGIDLRDVFQVAVLIAWPYCNSRVQQMLGRFRDENIPVIVIYADGSIELHIKNWAEEKYRVVSAFLDDDPVPDKELKRAAHAPREPEHSQRIVEDLSSLARKTLQADRRMHGKGVRLHARFWGAPRRQELFREQCLHGEESGTADTGRYKAVHLVALQQAGVLTEGTVIDAYSGGLSLQRTLGRIAPDTRFDIVNVDPHGYMFGDGVAAAEQESQGSSQGTRWYQGVLRGFKSVREQRDVRNIQTIVLNGLEFTSHRPRESTNGHSYLTERMRTLLSAVRTLPVGGTLVIHMPFEACTEQECNCMMRDALPELGLEVLREWSGLGTSTDNEGDIPFRIFTIVARKRSSVTAFPEQSCSATALKMTPFMQWTPHAREMINREQRHRRIHEPIAHTAFVVGGHDFSIGEKDAVATQRHREQADRIAIVVRAVQRIRQAAPTLDAYKVLSQKKRAQLYAEARIQPMELHMEGRPAFYPIDSEIDVLFPYDPQWGSETKES